MCEQLKGKLNEVMWVLMDVLKMRFCGPLTLAVTFHGFPLFLVQILKACCLTDRKFHNMVWSVNGMGCSGMPA